MTRALTLQRALLATVGAAVLAGIVPAGVALDRRLAGALESRARNDLTLAPRVFRDRQAMSADAMTMHAREFAQSFALGDALVRGDRVAVRRLAEEARAAVGGDPVVVGPGGDPWAGPASRGAVTALLPRTRAGATAAATVADGDALRDLALAGVAYAGRWVGAAGTATALDAQQAAVVAGLTRADVVIVGAGGAAVASTLDSTTTRDLVASLTRSRRLGARPSTSDGLVDAAVLDVQSGRRRWIVVTTPIAGAGTAVFVRDLAAELSVVPVLRRLALLSAAAALVLALVVGSFVAARLARPVRQLAGAADAMAHGAFDAPLPPRGSLALREVVQLSTAFAAMRAALAARLDELREANAALADRNARLTALQADLVQRERLAATGRLVGQLAHEIRNPVASLRNCLELIRRRVSDDAEALEFCELAIDELLRMHELAEQMLDLNRPRTTVAGHCRPAQVARDVVALLTMGAARDVAALRCVADDDAATAVAGIATDALKQVLLNLVQNAREAVAGDAASTPAPSVTVAVARGPGTVRVTVADDGPGIAADVLPRVFDPFFTTKSEMRGVGLGLFVAEGLVRAAGGRLTAESRGAAGDGTHGAVFRIELPAMDVDAAARVASAPLGAVG